MVKLKGIICEAQKKMYRTNHSALIEEYFRVLIEEYVSIEIARIVEEVFEVSVKKSLTKFDLDYDLVFLIFLVN